MKRCAPTSGDDTRKAEGVRAQARVPVPLKANRLGSNAHSTSTGESKRGSFEAHPGINCCVDEIGKKIYEDIGDRDKEDAAL
jgi:hypothetical protein